METTLEKLKKVNEALKKGEPGNTTEDNKGYSGYKPQYIIDCVNREFLGEWGVEVIEKKNYRDGKNQSLSFLGQEVDSMASHPDNQNDLGDAYKAAQTDALKKAFAHFSIGNRAYHGLLKK